MAYQNFAGVWLTQSNGAYDWLANQWQPVSLGGGVDTVKIWQSFTLPSNANNLIVFGDHNYLAGNNNDNVLIAEAPADVIYGARGSDVFVGSGGSGTTFIVAQGEGNKVIQNFAEGADTVRLIGGPVTSFASVQAAMSQQGSDVILNDGGTMIAFRNANVWQFQARDFQLPLNYATLGSPTFSEDFDSAQGLAGKWVDNYGFAGTGLNSFTLPGNAEQQVYTSASFQGTAGAPLGLNPFSFNGGVMTISAKPVSDYQSSQMWGYHYASGMLESNFAQTYGYFEINAALPHGQGLWPAFWLIGEQNREIDILEGLGSDTRVANNAIHSPSLPALGNPSFNPYGDGFHKYGVLWDPQHITFYVDGTPVWQTNTPYDMNAPMKMIVNLAVGGNWAGSPDGSTPWPAQMQIDYIRAYALPGAAGGSAAVAPPVAAPIAAPVAPPASAPVSSDGQVLTSPYPGAWVTGGAGADTLLASQGSDHLNGGGGADVFAFKAMPWSAGHISDFQVGVDRLDISALYANGYNGANPVADGYVSFESDGTGGTKVLLDTDAWGAANNIRFVVTTLDGVAPGGLTAAGVFGASGGASAPVAAPSSGGAAGQILTSSYPGAWLAGGAGADTLVASQGPDQLSGGAGADHFAYNALPWHSGHISDFTPGSDVLDLKALFAAAGYHGWDPLADGTLHLDSDGAGGSRVLLTTPASPWPTLITTLDHVAPGGLRTGDFLF